MIIQWLWGGGGGGGGGGWVWYNCMEIKDLDINFYQWKFTFMDMQGLNTIGGGHV